MSTPGQRTQDLRIKTGLSQAGLAKRVGVSAQSIQQLEADLVAHPRYIDDLARVLNTTREWLLSGKHPRDDEPPSETVVRTTQVMPILGIAVGGDNGEFSFNGNTVDYVTRPPQLAMVDGAYALYVMGSSMEPRYFEGELLYVNPNRPPPPGSFVIIQLRDERAMIKRLLRQDNERIVVEQYNPPTTFELPRSEVAHLHLVVQSGTP